MQRVPMKTPLVCLRITAYHSMLASRSPRTGCHGSLGRSSDAVMPAATSWFRVAT
jgi:hypothetical protein